MDSNPGDLREKVDPYLQPLVAYAKVYLVKGYDFIGYDTSA